MTTLSDVSLNFYSWLRKRQFPKFLPLLLEFLTLKKGDIVLDVGAGTGVVAEEIAKLSDEVFALEPNPKRVEYIKKKYPQVKAFDGTAEAIQFPEFYFTKIYSVNSLHHFRDKDAALYELNRVLKRGGVLVIKDLAPVGWRSKLESRNAGVNFWTAEKLKEKLVEAGFEVRDLRKVGNRDYFVCSSKV